ncbi:hypothetical protein H8E52_12375 [bacterium]|nr:hypothetical protein [bacterium]
MKSTLILALLLLISSQAVEAQSLDLAYKDYGLSFGNSKKFTGLRINLVDRDVERITGLNLTFWNPGNNPTAVYNGMTLALIGTKSQHIDGIALSGIGVTATEKIRGIAAGTLGVGARNFTGLALGLIMVDVQEHFRGVNISGGWTLTSNRLDGLAFSPGVTMAKQVRGVAIAGLFAGGEQSLTGLALGGCGVFSTRLRGLAIAGFGAGGECVDGVVITLGGIGGKQLNGIMLAGLGLGASEHIRGLAIGGILSFAPEVTGLTIGAMNGLYIDRIDLEDFLHFKLANEKYTGLSIGLVNYSKNLNGVQLGLLNYAANNPKWLRLLPLLNVHL